MNRRMLVVLYGRTDAQKARIAAAARARGFEAVFRDNWREAVDDAAEAEIILSHTDQLARRAPKLRWMCASSAGINQFQGEGVFLNPEAMLTNSSGAYGVTIAEHVTMVTLEMLRRQPEYNGVVERREWTRSLPVRSILGSRAVLLGTGDIGREVALRLRAFRPARILGVNRGGRCPGDMFDGVATLDGLDAALAECDLLVISLPGTRETFHLLDARRLSLLPDGALVVNVGRGTVVDQAALAAELRAGRLRAALDVFEQEPIPAGDPLWECPNLLITPHVAGNMTLAYTVDRIVDLFLEDFENYCEGRPLRRRVDLDRGY